MKKITLLFIFLIAFCWQSNAQFTESFETEIPANWTIVDNASTEAWVFNDDPAGGAQDGDGVASIIYDASTAHDDYLITPAISVAASTNDRLSFYIKSRSGTYLEPYEVLLSTTGTMAADFSITLQASSNAPNAWTFNQFDLSSYTGSTVYVAIHATGLNEFELFVDNVVNDTPPACGLPMDLSATTTETTAVLLWSAPSFGTPIGYNWEIQPEGIAQGTGGAIFDNVSGTTDTVTGLTAATTYDLFVQTDCDANGTSLWAGPYSFSTSPANDDCVNASNVLALPYNDSLDATGSTNNGGFVLDCTSGMNDGIWYTFEVDDAGTIDVVVSAVVGWDPELAVYSGACGAFTCVTSADSGFTGDGESVSFSGTASTQYWVNIGHYSGDTDNPEGPFSISVSTPDTATVNTSLSLKDFEIQGFNYFPNPVKNTLNLNSQKKIQNIVIYNLLGQEVLQSTPNDVTSVIDMSSLHVGTYFVKVTINNMTETVKIIKK